MIVDFTAGVRTNRFEDADDVTTLLARFDGAAVYKDTRAIQTGHGHDTAGHVLVTATDGHYTVKALTAHDGFDRVSDDFAADQAVAHTGCAHRNTIRNGDGVEQHAFTASGVNAFDGFARQVVNVHVAGGHHAPGTGHANLRLFEIGIFKTNGAQHRAAGSLRHPVNNDRGILAFVIAHDRPIRI